MYSGDEKADYILFCFQFSEPQPEIVQKSLVGPPSTAEGIAVYQSSVQEDPLLNPSVSVLQHILLLEGECRDLRQ